MTEETPTDLAPENVNVSIVYSRDIEMTAPPLITTNGMTAETPTDLAPANVNVSIMYSRDIEMTAGQPNASIVWGTAFGNGQQQQEHSRSFCDNLCLRMKKARISQGSIQ